MIAKNLKSIFMNVLKIMLHFLSSNLKSTLMLLMPLVPEIDCEPMSEVLLYIKTY
jgi:hypothetical protein